MPYLHLHPQNQAENLADEQKNYIDLKSVVMEGMVYSNIIYIFISSSPFWPH